MTHHTLFSDKSDIYAQARPSYPDALYGYIASLCSEHERVWDSACGSGQAAVDLGRYFQQVAATDISAAQIANAKPAANVTYRMQSAEKTTFPNDHFDLVCVAQALHWFDYAQFWPEVRRVLKPNGVFAAWGYSWFNITPEIDAAIQHHFLSVIGPYWAVQNQLLWDNYRDVPFPFTPVEAPLFHIRLRWDLDALFHYLHTWSATRRCMDAIGDQFFRDAYKQVAHAWGDVATRYESVMPICLIIGRI